MGIAAKSLLSRKALFNWEEETSKTEVLQTPSAIKSKPRSGARVVKVFEFLKKMNFRSLSISFNFQIFFENL